MFQRLALVLLAAVAGGLLVLNGLAWTGGLVDDASPPGGLGRASTPQPDPGPVPISRQRSKRLPVTEQTTPAPMVLTISATRGDCWVEVHAPAKSGSVLFAGTLATGRTLKFNRPKLWLRLGAASNVDIMVNGRPSTIPSGTVELALPA